MSDQPVSQDTGTPSAVEQQGVPSEPAAFSDASAAASYLSSIAQAKRKAAQNAPAPNEQIQDASTAESAEPVEDEQTDSGEQLESEPEETPVTAETDEEAEAADDTQPPIEPPRSWPKEDKDHFASLDRKTQEILARREEERDRHFLRRQNESTEQHRAEEAKAQQVEQLRQHYEAQIPMAAQAIQQALLAEFPDIKTDADVERLAREDWPRYIQWDLKTKQFARWQNEMQQSQLRQQQQVQDQLQKWAQSQDEEVERVLNSMPQSERTNVANEARKMLIDYGMTEDQIVQLWSTSILRSAPVQRALADAARYRIAKRNASKPAAKPAQPVQKPGTTAKPQSTAFDAQIKALEGKSELTPEEAGHLLMLKASRRAP